jgi:hypothetical protein
MGVLDELKDRAARGRPAADERAEDRPARDSEAMAAALPAIFRIHLCLRDFAAQLELLQSEVMAEMDIQGLGRLAFRQSAPEIEAPGNPPDRVTARFALRCERRGRFELTGVPNVNQWLDQTRRRGLLVRLERMLEPRGTLERAEVSLGDSLAASLEFTVDRDGSLLLSVRNFDELGERCHLLAPAAITSRWLDELTRFLLRKPHRFLVSELPPDLRYNLRRRLEIEKRRNLPPDAAKASSGLQELFRRRRVLRLGFGELRFELTQAGGEFLIGRSDSCDLVVGAPRISRFHARIEHRDGRFLLLDESRNGTWVRFADGTQQRVGSIPVSLEGRGQIALTGPPGDANPHVIEFEV